ncbi:MAG: DUF4468 domain-containing protein [Cyclobacteriaceae bacterium]|nr:DUF4468 domain-containing protein [Cyclobacteriaceae bacterium]
MRLLAFLLICLSHSAFAQQNVFYLDEDKRYYLSEVEELPEMTLDQLFINAHAFMNSIQAEQAQYDAVPQSDTLKAIKTRGSFTVYNFGSLKKHIDGVVSYHLIIEMKAGKYRYKINEFYFTPYARNRYGKFVPLSGKVISLETKPSKLNNKNWNYYKVQVLQKSHQLIQHLHESMLHQETTENGKDTNMEKW